MSNFPLFDRAEESGVFKAQNGWLISAPTASGKSQIGREVIKRNLPSKPAMEVFLYLVPFKELAEEVFARLRSELPPQTRLFIKTGDYDRPFDAHEADVIVATYESIDGMIQQGMKFQPTIVVADEFSIISDEARGAKIESLIAYLAKIWDGTVPYILSAVLDDPERISKWLGISWLKGTKNDRPVPLDPFEIPYSKGKKDDTVEKLLKDNLPNNFLIFCYTKRGTEKLAFNIADLVSKHMSGDEKIRAKQFAETLKIDFPYVVGIPELISKGVAYHHSNLEVDLRNRISTAFRERIIKVVVATTTLAAGINMPARFVIVRDVERYPAGLIPVSEMVNMLGRAGRPMLDTKGTGLFMVDRLKMKGSDYAQFIERVKDSKVERIESQIPKSKTSILQFILSTVARLKGATRDQIVEVYNTTLAGFEDPITPPLPLSSELTLRIEKFVRPPSNPTNIDGRTVKVVNGVLYAKGGGGGYEISISEDGPSCSCAAFRFQRNGSCKHTLQLQYEALAGEIGTKYPEAKVIAISTFKGEGVRNNPVYMLSAGIDVLLSWRFLDEQDGLMHITDDGRQALTGYLLEMDHIRLLRDRMKAVTTAKDEKEIIKWAIEDYRLPGLDEEEDGQAGEMPEELEDPLWNYIEGQPYKLILKQEHIRKFLATKDRLDQIFNAYLTFCAKENKKLVFFIRTARRRVHYGSPIHLLPLLCCDLDPIDDAKAASALYAQGIRDVRQLSRCDGSSLISWLSIPADEAERTVQTAAGIVGLIESASGDKSMLGTLSTKTGIKVNDLVDYFLPAGLVELA